MSSFIKKGMFISLYWFLYSIESNRAKTKKSFNSLPEKNLSNRGNLAKFFLNLADDFYGQWNFSTFHKSDKLLKQV